MFEPPPPTDEEITLYRQGAKKFQILAYIERGYAPADPDLDGLPNDPIGYLCDATLALIYEGEGSSMLRLPIHFGNGVVYPTFEAAQKAILDECGILVEAIPEAKLPDFPRTGLVSVRVGRFVQEFVASGRSREEIEAEAVMPPMPLGWRRVEDFLKDFRKPAKVRPN